MKETSVDAPLSVTVRARRELTIARASSVPNAIRAGEVIGAGKTMTVKAVATAAVTNRRTT
jgi:hypothetical protein